MSHHAAALKRKLGPLPVWGWAIVAGVVLYVVRNRSSSGGGILGGLLGGYGSSSSGAGNTQLQAGEPGPMGQPGRPVKPGKPAKPPRVKKHKKPRKHKKHPKHPKAGKAAPQLRAAVARHVNNHVPPRGGSHQRNRTGVVTNGSMPAGSLYSRGRRMRLPKFGLDAMTSHPSRRDTGRARLRTPIDAGVRAHQGEHTPGAGPHFRSRPLTGNTEGSRRRLRSLTGPAGHTVDRMQPAPPAAARTATASACSSSKPACRASNAAAS